MKVYNKELMTKRDEIAAHLRGLGLYCLSQFDMTKVSGGAVLFIESWVQRKGNRAMLLAVDKFRGVCSYRACTEEVSMEAEKAAITQYFTEVAR
jgi:hypothetical protein